jgi:hypothetical protein
MREVLSASWLGTEANQSVVATMRGAFAEHAILNGQLDLAEKELALLDDYEHAYGRAAMLRARMMLLVRKKDFAAAARFADEHWRASTASAAAAFNNRFRLAWALSLRQLDATSHARRIADLVAGARPFWKGQFIPLTANWPEMKDFLAEHGLTDNAAA